MTGQTKILGFLLASLGVIVALSLLSYSPNDLSLVSYPHHQLPKNLIGIAGAYVSFLLFFVFGYASYFVPFYLFFSGVARFEVIRFQGFASARSIKILSFIFFLIFLAAFLGLFADTDEAIYRKAGFVGFLLVKFFSKYMGRTGSILVFTSSIAMLSVLLFGLLWIDIFLGVKFTAVKLGSLVKAFFVRLGSMGRSEDEETSSQIKREKMREKAKVLKERAVGTKDTSAPDIKIYTPTVPKKPAPTPTQQEESAPVGVNSEEAKKRMEMIEAETKKSFDPATYKLPTIDIFKVPPALDYRQLKEDIQENAKNLEDTLLDFGVSAKVVSVQKGPVVTRYELQPKAGIKIQKISSLADDIALAMKSSGVRIVAPIPGRGTVGVEIPNIKKHIVYLREVLEDKAFASSASKLSLALGKDVAGNALVADLKDMPHLLIAGTTGSGKTVCVNSIISAILCKARPDEVKFILVDPKMVELAPFAGIPHLLHPLVSNAKKAFAALNWCVEEMERRYQLLADDGSRNIDLYNKKEFRLPFILVIVDELADLMVVAKDNIETAIQRLAQLSRAVGIHLILATQRPSVDVVTGVIKANFPARISFKVSSKVDSRTVLDSMGAEKLLGKGDMLLLRPGLIKNIRAQGCFVDDEDINKLTDFVRSQGGPVYEEKIFEAQKKTAIQVESDELLDEAIKVILQARQASASLLQRRLRVGYTRAARLLDLMEQEGVVGPFQGSKAREILVDPAVYLGDKYMV